MIKHHKKNPTQSEAMENLFFEDQASIKILSNSD